MKKIKFKIVHGRDIKVGDVIEVWWEPGKAKVVKLTPPHSGSLTSYYGEGTQLADFSSIKSDMIIAGNDRFKVFNRRK